MTIDKNYLYSGGLAEFVSRPTQLTFSFFRHWFTGKQSVGKAMAMLQLPYCPVSTPLLVLINGELYVDLQAETETLYTCTVFNYKPQKSIHKKPEQAFALKRLLNPESWNGTFQNINRQAYWLAHPDEVRTFVKKHLDAIPDVPTQQTIEELDTFMEDAIWPTVIAISVINEFFQAVAAKDHGLQKQSVHDKMNHLVVHQDWFFQSIVKMREVKAGTLSLEAYLADYGMRADKDYELCSRRWHEIPDEIKMRVHNIEGIVNDHIHEMPPDQLSQLAQIVVDMQIYRIQAKRKALIYMDKLRALILTKYGEAAFPTLTRSFILFGKAETFHSLDVKLDEDPGHIIVRDNGSGNPISAGVVRGVTQHITSATDEIHNGALCIFPNTSPEFSPYYKKCSGIIFMKGGVTSHGAIVAREFGIPAIVYHQTDEIPREMLVEIDGKLGTWKVV